MIINADALEMPLADGSVQCVVTSPPYWGLRDYGTAAWVGGDEGCDHVPERVKQRGAEFRDRQKSRGYAPGSNFANYGDRNAQSGDFEQRCKRCDAQRVDNQLGLESTPEEFIANMVAVFREVWRVLRDDGTCWVNLGDSYSGSTGNRNGSESSTLKGGRGGCAADAAVNRAASNQSFPGLKPKDLCGIPWRVALALQADGWYLRSDIIWSKPNPMPESCTDRPTKAHEYLFLLTKRPRYYYDADAVRERGSGVSGGACFGKQSHDDPMAQSRTYDRPEYGDRNRRTVWTISTESFSEAHFATFPRKLVEPCVLAGTSAKGCCPACGAGWERVVERVSTGKRYSVGKSKAKNDAGLVTGFSGYDDGSSCPVFTTTGWSPACRCDAGDPVPCVVFDPFAGSGTTGVVALHHGRRFVGTELSPEYCAMATKRIAKSQRPQTYRDETVVGDAPLFETAENRSKPIQTESVVEGGAP